MAAPAQIVGRSIVAPASSSGGAIGRGTDPNSGGAITPGAARWQPTPRAPERPTQSVAQTQRRLQMEQAPADNQSALPPGFFWAVLTTSVTIGGHTFPPGTKIVVAPAQTSSISTGKAHLTTPVTKVWVKFGQSFDASSWISGNLSPSTYQLSSTPATWGSQGFGAPPKTGLGQEGIASTIGTVVIITGAVIGGLWLYNRYVR